MSDQLTTRDEFRRDLAALHETLGAEYERAADNLMHGATHADVFGDLACTIADARHQLERLLELIALDRLADLAITSPARPLEAVLADIRALGHQVIRLSWHGGSWYLDTDTGSVQFDLARQGDQAYAREYREAIESALSWGEDPIALAEARLEQLKELREQQRTAVVALVETLSYRPKPRFIVERRPGGEGVMYWMVIDTTGEQENFLSYVEELARANADLRNAAHAETADLEWLLSQSTEEERSRWNVWSKDSDGDWSVTNSNLNQEQALAAIRRLMAAALVHGPAGATFTMLPVGQVPGGPPVDPSDAVVFLNPDPEAPSGPVLPSDWAPFAADVRREMAGAPEDQPVADGPTDDEEAGETIVAGYHTVAEKSCPECSHPMMSGPLEVRNPQDEYGPKITAAWWCANCHHSIEQGAEELARADRERESQASEEPF